VSAQLHALILVTTSEYSYEGCVPHSCSGDYIWNIDENGHFQTQLQVTTEGVGVRTLSSTLRCL
jgi:hypothetical protein